MLKSFRLDFIAEHVPFNDGRDVSIIAASHDRTTIILSCWENRNVRRDKTCLPNYLLHSVNMLWSYPTTEIDPQHHNHISLTNLHQFVPQFFHRYHIPVSGQSYPHSPNNNFHHPHHYRRQSISGECLLPICCCRTVDFSPERNSIVVLRW